MTLGFSVEIEGSYTYFPEKILSAARDLVSPRHFDKYYRDAMHTNYNDKYRFSNDVFVLADPKLHSIRDDVNDLWQPGNLIHPVIYNRSKRRLQFAPTLVCVSTQKIEIFHNDYSIEVYIDEKMIGKMYWWGDIKNPKFYGEIEKLAKNDGFKGPKEFFQYFNTNYTGKLIHWTDLKY